MFIVNLFFIAVVIFFIMSRVNKKIRLLQENIDQQVDTLRERIHILEKNIVGDHQLQPEIQKSTLQPQKMPDQSIPPILSDYVETIKPTTLDLSQNQSTSSVSDPSFKLDDQRGEGLRSAHQKALLSSPPKDNPLIKAFRKVIDYFKTGNTAVKIGVLVLFFGISFLVKFVAEQGFFPIEFRLMGAAFAAIVMAQVGWRLRNKSPEYALIIQGGGIGIFFITTFAAFQMYHLIPATLAFLVLVALASCTALMAIAQDSKSLAIFGIVGGFLAPVLASTGDGNHVVLFSYYLALNVGIVTIAWFKAWRVLNLIGFVFTYIIGVSWGVLQYSSDNLWTVEPFLILFFLIYLAIPVLFAKRQKPEIKGMIDGTLVFGNTIIAFAIQSQLMQGFEYGMAWSSMTVSFIYLALGRWLYVQKNPNYRLLIDAFLAIGVIFATLTIPLVLDGHWTAVTWAAEAAGIYWLALRQDQLLRRVFGMFLLIASATAFLAGPQEVNPALPLINSFFLGCLVIALSSLFMSWQAYKNRDKITTEENKLMIAVFIFGHLWWIFGGWIEIENNFVSWWYATKQTYWALHNFGYVYVKQMFVLYAGLGFLLSAIIGRKIGWKSLSRFSFLMVFFVGIYSIRNCFVFDHPFAMGGYWVWPLIVTVYYYILHTNEKVMNIHKDFFRWGHAAITWVIVFTLAKQAFWLVDQFSQGTQVWGIAAFCLVPIAATALVLFSPRILNWPVRKHLHTYILFAVSPLMLLLWFWMLALSTRLDGSAAPLTYIPILNPLEFMQLSFMLLLPLWLSRIQKMIPLETKQIGIALGVTYFCWLNTILFRSIHHFAAVPYQTDALFESALVQMSLSIFWSVIGVSLMIYSSQRTWRQIWVVGASLMGVVVSKLFLIDLSNSGTIERIISFISVGIILLLVGYFSPIPPKSTHKGSLPL